MSNCPECGKPVAETDSFCPYCGKPLEKIEYCSRCGAKISEGGNYCPSCGNPVGGSVHVRSGSLSHDKDMKTVAGILAIILGGIGVHYFYLGKTTAGLITILLSLCSCGLWTVLMFI